MTISICSDRLDIQIQEPGSSYKRSRFDWSGICQQINLDQQQTYLSQEATAAELGTEGIGLIDEFGITSPIGYDQIGVWDWFPKIGVGFLQKVSTDPYNFFFDYPIKPVPIEMHTDGEDKVSFLQENEILDGWGWRLQKTFTVDGPSLRIDYALENCGEKPITTEQYNHNFIAINSQPIGPDYQLSTSFPINFEFVDGGLNLDTQQVNLAEIPSTYIYALQSKCAGLQNVDWSLIHKPTGHGLRVREGFPLFRFTLWGKSHVISPEFFVWIDLKPGQTQTWHRKYCFY